MGAWLLSRWQPAKRQIILRRTVHMRSLERQLDRMPCAYLPSTANHLEWLTDSLSEVATSSPMRQKRADYVKYLNLSFFRSFRCRQVRFCWLDYP